MKGLMTLFFGLMASLASGQSTDSVMIHRVDSLVAASRELTDYGDYVNALRVNQQAERLALEIGDSVSLTYAKAVFNHGRILQSSKEYPEAEAWYLRSKVLNEKAAGKEHAGYASSLLGLAYINLYAERYDIAESYFKTCIAIRKKVLGQDHPDYVKSLIALSQYYEYRKMYGSRIPLLMDALAARERTLGRNHLSYVNVLFFLGNSHYMLRDFRKAEPFLLQAMSILRENNWTGEEMFTNCMFLLADMYHLQGNYEKAAVQYTGLVNLALQKEGKQSVRYAIELTNLGGVYTDMEDYGKALSVLTEAKTIWESLYDLDNLSHANCLAWLASISAVKGQTAQAEALYLDAKSIFGNYRNKKHGMDDPLFAQTDPAQFERIVNNQYAQLMINIGHFFVQLGQYDKAEKYFLESKVLREQVFGKEDIMYAYTLNELGSLYTQIRQLSKAETVLQESRAIFEKVHGKDNINYASSLNGLIYLYLVKENYAGAAALIREAKTVFKAHNGTLQTAYAYVLTYEAQVEESRGNAGLAEELYLQVKSILEKNTGKENEGYLSAMTHLAYLKQTQGQPLAAAGYYADYFAISKSMILTALHHLSEQEMNQYLNVFRESSERVFSLARNDSAVTGLTGLCYNNTLFYKGFLLYAYNRNKKELQSDSLTASQYEQLQFYRRSLAKEYAKPLAERKNVADLESRSNSLEKELSGRVAGYSNAMKQVDWKAVQQSLRAGEAALEFIHFRNGGPGTADSTQYAAILIRPGDTAPQFISLFEERSIDSLLATTTVMKADYVNRLYTLADRGIITERTPKKNLYELVWKPLEKYLPGIHKIWFSPSGLLNRINLDAIPVSNEEVLADRYQLVELNSTRQLVVKDVAQLKDNGAVLFGGIIFDNATEGNSRGIGWNYLPGTEKEVDALESMMKTAGMAANKVKGMEASEEAFKKIGTDKKASPRILHIATHGYFFPDPGLNRGANSQPADESVFRMSEHPMLRSGLILAGGNTGWQNTRWLDEKEDGVLTAFEISQMNLSNTELVVLSACETGLGTIQGNEGVYGLQRAFKIAGAKYLVMSLWQVPDKQTSVLMLSFYKKWLLDKMNIPDAFHAAQKELRDSGLDPYYWAGFVLVE